MHPRVLIIATTPYSENYSSRSLDAYFHYWEKDNVAQICTRNIIPTKGHCGELFQISDAKLLKRWMLAVKAEADDMELAPMKAHGELHSGHEAEAELARGFFSRRIASDVVVIRQRKSREAAFLCIGCDFFRRHAAVGDERVDM